MLSLSDILLMFGVSVLTLAVAFAVFRFTASPSSKSAASMPSNYGEIEFTFSEARCVKASPSGLDLVNNEAATSVTLNVVTTALSRRFDSLPALLLEAQETQQPIDETLPSSVHHDGARLHVVLNAGSRNFHVLDPTVPSAADRHRAMARKAQLKLTFETLNKLPQPIWITTSDSKTLWSNSAYNSLNSPQTSSSSVFQFDTIKSMHGTGDRVSLVHPRIGGQTHWFDVSMLELEHDSYLNYAINVDGLIAAEVAQRKFVQTLAKTFAQLSIGLAIFDRDRRLVLFNPALVDLTALPAHFLTSQPNLQSFFDQLRENRIMPEPKDYASWRSQIAELVVQSVGGNYQETWALPSGLTYRVSGRPHPDGAIALLVEDITAEITLTRRFKGQIELGNSALETLKDAVIIFSSDGSVAFWNAAFKRFFSVPDDLAPIDQTVTKTLHICGEILNSDDGFDALKKALQKPRGSSSVSGNVTLKDGELLSYDLRTHGGTSAIVTFHTSTSAARHSLPKLVPAG